MIVAIHQPNYLPWLGYFHKIAAADVFVFLSDVQFSKGSYTNRVRIKQDGKPRWLTVPVSHAFGDPIDAVRCAGADWVGSHLDTLRGAYGKTAAFAEVWQSVEALFANLPESSLATVNEALVTRIADRLGLKCRFERAAALGVPAGRSDDRLVALTAAVDPRGTYLSGKGGAKYQDPEKFARAGLHLAYTNFIPEPYRQPGAPGDFTSGLSLLDAVFNIGWSRTAELVRP
jgi:hypothetical protein